MAETARILPSAKLRKELVQRGAGTVSRCYQCATCTSVCELSKPEAPFPRQQMLLAQWGQIDRLAADPAIWLCHQCADCSDRCPRDARPGDVLQGLRATVIQRMAFPGFLGRLVGNAGRTWPLLILGPWLFWVAVIALTGGLSLPAGTVIYEKFVPHSTIYWVFYPVAAWVTLAAFVSGMRFWKLLGEGKQRKGSFMGALISVFMEIAVHRGFATCPTATTRRWGHWLLIWGFVGAAVTSALLVVGIYILHMEMPVPQLHPFKILGNLSALFLMVGVLMLVTSRFGSESARIKTSAFDGFFLFVVAMVIVTGIVIEIARYILPPLGSYGLYTFHLGLVTTLFLTFPYSKFAHMLFRTLSLVHQRMVSGQSDRN